MKHTTVIFVLILLGAAFVPGALAADSGDDTQYDGGTPEAFRAHPGWLDDKPIFYYRFSLFMDMVNMPSDQPVAPVFYLWNTTDDSVCWDNWPILAHERGGWEFMPGNAANYADFLNVVFAHVSTCPDPFSPSGWDSWGDLNLTLGEWDGSNANYTATDLVLNMPQVQSNSTLNDLANTGDAPINVVKSWWRGNEVHHFIFDVSSPTNTTMATNWADHYNTATRTDSSVDWEVNVVDIVNTGTELRVDSEPIWHVNQFRAEAGTEGGGPDPVGQKNVIAVDRPDAAYSPLWQVKWYKQTPLGYAPNMASEASQFTEANGFIVENTPMLVNCPNIGPHGGGSVVNAEKTTFPLATATQDYAAADTIDFEGSMIMPMAEMPVTYFVNGIEMGTTNTHMMGAFSFTLNGSDLAEGENVVTAEGADGAEWSNWTVMRLVVDDDDDSEDTPGFSGLLTIGAILVATLLGVMFARRRQQ